jgi:hypothetical protein
MGLTRTNIHPIVLLASEHKVSHVILTRMNPCFLVLQLQIRSVGTKRRQGTEQTTIGGFAAVLVLVQRLVLAWEVGTSRRQDTCTAHDSPE